MVPEEDEDGTDDLHEEGLDENGDYPVGDPRRCKEPTCNEEPELCKVHCQKAKDGIHVANTLLHSEFESLGEDFVQFKVPCKKCKRLGIIRVRVDANPDVDWEED